MHKRFLIGLLTLCFSTGVVSGCGANDNKNQSSTPQQSSPDPLKPGEWDLYDVDISHIKSDKIIAFTLDDGPHGKTRDLIRIFQTFNQENPDFEAHATLFNLGQNISPAYKMVLQSAVEVGFEMGNHTYTHANLTAISDEEYNKEINRTDILLKEIDGKDRHLIRPPGGNYNDHVLSLAPAPMVYWSNGLDTIDWQSQITENDIYSCVMNNLRPGGIVLMHQQYDKTIATVERLLPALMRKGFQVVTVSELAKYYGFELFQGVLYDEFK